MKIKFKIEKQRIVNFYLFGAMPEIINLVKTGKWYAPIKNNFYLRM